MKKLLALAWLLLAGPALGAGLPNVPDYPNATTPRGPKGDMGCSLLPTNGAPAASLGRDCDYAFDAASGRVYGPKLGGQWGAGVVMSPVAVAKDFADRARFDANAAKSANAAAQTAATSATGAAALVTAANFTPSWPTRTFMQAAVIPESVTSMTVEALVLGTPCRMHYIASAVPTGTYGEVAIGARYATPVYSRPLRACEFGAVANASAPDGGAAFTATATGNQTLAVSSTAGMQLGMNVAMVNWASSGATNVPVGTKITAIGAGSITVSNNVAAGAGLRMVAYWLLDASNVTGTDNRAAIQAMIDYAAANNNAEFDIDEGKYRVDGMLRLGGANFNAKRFTGGSRPSYSGVAGGVTIYCTAVDRPCIDMAGQRAGLLSGVALIGPNRNYAQYAQWFTRTISPNEADWLSPELTRSGSSPGGLQRYSPLAAVAIDALRGSCGAAPYAGTYDDAASSDITIEHLSISGFAVGVTGPNCADTQGDFTRIRDIAFDAVIVPVSVGNSQSRGVEIRNLIVGGCHSAITGTRFGGRIGKFGGPIENVSLDGCYQLFDFTGLSYSGPLHFRHVYSEGGVRIGRAVCAAAFCPDVTIDGADWQLDNALTGQIPARLIETGGKQNVILSNNTTVTPPRITTLAHSPGGGQAMSLTMDGGAVLGPGYNGIGGPGGSAALQAAINATGGINLGTAALNTLNLNQAYVRAPFKAAFYSSPSGGIGSHSHAESIVFDASGSLNRAPLTLVARRFVDANGREWKLQRPAPALLDLSAPALVATGMSLSCDTLSFTYAGSYQALGGVYALQPGYLLEHDPTGINFVVTSVTASAGDWAVVAQQQNGISVTPGTNTCAANTITAPTLQSGYTFVFPTGFALPKQVNFGRFTAGSSSVTNVSRGDGNGADLASWFAAGDILFSADVDLALDPLPILKRTTLASVTPGSPGSLTLSAAAAATGDFPVYPVPIR